MFVRLHIAAVTHLWCLYENKTLTVVISPLDFSFFYLIALQLRCKVGKEPPLKLGYLLGRYKVALSPSSAIYSMESV